MLTKSNAIGYAILSLIFDRLSDEEIRQLAVEPYLNGRESGFAVFFWPGDLPRRKDRKLVFSEDRRSDGLVVYEGRISDFSMQGNGLNDQIYRDSRMFSPDKICDCVDHIVQRLRERDWQNTEATQ